MAQSEPLHIDAGATFERQFTYAKDGGAWGSDFHCRVMIRDSEGAVALDVTPTFNRTTGDISLSLTPTQTSTLTQPRYRWSMELIGNSETVRLLQGRVTVSAEVVR